MVTVIIPAFNTEKYVKECIDSILNQTYNNIEIIIVDDGSTDSTGKILEEYKEISKKIKVITTKNNGQGYARNLALESATGDYIMFMDSDDYLKTNTIELAVNRICREKADFVLFDWQYYLEDTKEFTERDSACFSGNDNFEGEFTSEIFRQVHYFPVNKLTTANFLVKNRIKFLEGYMYEDVPHFVHMIMCAQKVSYVNEKLYVIRKRTGSTTKSNYNTGVHSSSYLKAVEASIDITNNFTNKDITFLYLYLIRKLFSYYSNRVAPNLRKQFVYDFVEIISKLRPITVDKETKNKSKIVYYMGKYKVFTKRKKRTFYFLCRIYKLINRFK